MSANRYFVGQLVRASVIFTVADVATNPTTVTVSVRDPDGTVTTPQAQPDSTGHYHVDINADTAGEWQYRFEGEGAAQAVSEGAFIAQTRFPE